MIRATRILIMPSRVILHDSVWLERFGDLLVPLIACRCICHYHSNLFLLFPPITSSLSLSLFSHHSSSHALFLSSSLTEDYLIEFPRMPREVESCRWDETFSGWLPVVSTLVYAAPSFVSPSFFDLWHWKENRSTGVQMPGSL